MFLTTSLLNKISYQRKSEFKLIGFGIKHERYGVEQIIPNIYNSSTHYSLIFNHAPVDVQVSGTEEAFPENSLVLWDSNSHVLYGKKRDTWNISWLQFAGAYCDALIKDYRICVNQRISMETERIVSVYWKLFYEELSEKKIPNTRLLMHHIQGIFLEAADAQHNSKTSNRNIPEHFLDLKRYIDDNFLQQLTLQSLASKIHLSPVYLSRKFKEYFEISPIEYMINLRVNNAGLYLRNPDLSIKEVAALSGYSDSLYFSRQFKHYMGVSPDNYRKKYLRR